MLKKVKCFFDRQVFITYLGMIAISLLIGWHLLIDHDSFIGSRLFGREFFIGACIVITVTSLAAILFARNYYKHPNRKITINSALVFMMVFIALYEVFQIVYEVNTSGISYAIIVDGFLVIASVGYALRLVDYIYCIWVIKEIERTTNG